MKAKSRSRSPWPKLARAELRRIEHEQDFIARLVRIKDEAGRLRLYRTMHALDSATRTVGYELAEAILKNRRRPRV